MKLIIELEEAELIIIRTLLHDKYSVLEDRASQERDVIVASSIKSASNAYNRLHSKIDYTINNIGYKK